MSIKKPAIICVPFLALFCSLLTSCSKNSICPLIYGDINATTVKDVTYAELNAKVDEKENFLLAVQPSNPCRCWNDFLPIVNDYIGKNHVIVYHIRLNEMSSQNYFGLNLKEGYTTFAIFKDGSVMSQQNSGSNSVLEDKSEFENYMKSNVTMPTMYYVSLDNVNTMYHQNTKSVIYFARGNCGDCSYADKHILKEYAVSNRDSKYLYILDCETIGVREYDEHGNLTEKGKQQWQEFKDTYGLSKINNPEFGYDSGYVPTFLLVNGNQTETYFHSGAVYFNDTISKIDNKYFITNTYYTKDRNPHLTYLLDLGEDGILENAEIKENQISARSTTYSWRHEYAALAHDLLLKKFLNYALPLTYNVF